jgi:opacity protein-like surface antigen
MAISIALGASSEARSAGDVEEFAGGSWYVSAFGGGAFMEDYTVFSAAFGGITNTLGTDAGFVVGGTVGKEFMPGWRGEIEVSYWEVGPDSWTNSGFVGTGLNGHVSSVNVLANVWYDFNLDTFVDPYIGGGIGIGFVDGNLSTTNGVGLQFDGDDAGLAYQLGTGLKIGLSPMMDLDIGYRYRGVRDVSFAAGPGIGSPWSSDDINVHIIQGSLIWKLGAY